MKNELVIIDYQFDFCDPKGALYVPGSEKDCIHLSSFIDKNCGALSAIHATMDAHQPYHIAHPLFWKNADGKHPDFYTIISLKDIEHGKFTPSDPAQKKYAAEYVAALEKKGKYQLCIWPPHCLTGSLGQALQSTVFDAVKRWQENNIGKTVDFITKAESPFTEQYSAIEAEVPLKADETTHTNMRLINELKNADRIIFAGEALSHCVANTIRDVLKYVPASKMTLLTDCTSSVAGFENAGRDFVTEFEAAGGKLETSALKV